MRGIGLRHSVARDADHDERASQTLDHQRRHEAAAIAANIDNQRVFPDLREIKLGEFVQAGTAHVWNVQITDVAVGFFRDVIDVLLNPI